MKAALHLFLATIAIAGIVWLAMHGGPPAASTHASQLPARAHLNWPEIPFVPVQLGTMPSDLPRMEPICNVDFSSAGDPASSSHRQLLERLKVVILRNVVPGIGPELDGLLREHKIIYAIDPFMEAAASFHVEDGYPYMHFSANLLAGLDTPASVVSYMTVVAHEFIHYKQWKSSRDPVERATFLSPRPALDETTCRTLWKIEREAYLKANCEWGGRFGLAWKFVLDDPQADFCLRANSPQAFDQAFYYAMTRHASGSASAACVEAWWDAAGGPRAK